MAEFRAKLEKESKNGGEEGAVERVLKTMSRAER